MADEVKDEAQKDGAQKNRFNRSRQLGQLLRSLSDRPPNSQAVSKDIVDPISDPTSDPTSDPDPDLPDSTLDQLGPDSEQSGSEPERSGSELAQTSQGVLTTSALVTNIQTVQQQIQTSTRQISQSTAKDLKGAIAEVIPDAERIEEVGVLIDQRINALGITLRQEMQLIAEQHRQNMAKLQAQHRADLQRQALYQWTITAALVVAFLARWSIHHFG